MANKIKAFWDKIIYPLSDKKVAPDGFTQVKTQPIADKINENIALLEGVFGDSYDVNIKEILIGKNDTKAIIVNVSGISDKAIINEYILAPLMSKDYDVTNKNIDYVQKAIVHIDGTEKADSLNMFVKKVLEGDTGLMIDGFNQGLLMNTRGYEHRGVEPTETEKLVRGSRSGFTETLQVNTALVRQIIKSGDLAIENFPIGRRTQTAVCLVYLRSVADDKIVNKLKRQLNDIDIDGILESEYIEELINDNRRTLFPTIGATESPVRLAGKILEGRVGIMIDGTPFALTVPYLFTEMFQAMDDYTSRPLFSTSMRFLRYVAFLLTLFLPGIYIALQAIHPSTIPTRLLLTMASTHSNIPFPVFIETAIMLLFFEILREAGVRMPKPVGQAVSIVGALVLGDAAVAAGLVAPAIVITVALTGILSFLVPPQMDAVTLMRVPILIMAGMLGLVGLTWCFILLIVYLSSLSSYGVPYLSPISPYVHRDMKDTIIRSGFDKLTTRPTIIGQKNFKRQKNKGKKS